MNVRKPLGGLAVLALSALALTAVSQAPVGAAQQSGPVPSAGAMPNAVPSTATPAVNDGEVRAIAKVGTTMVMGGNFTLVNGVSRPSIAAFNQATGALTSFAPTVNGQVDAVLPGPNDHTVYIGGAFTQVNSVATQFIAELDLTTGALVAGFKAPAFDYGEVNDLVQVGNRLYVGGFFTNVGGKAHVGLVSLNATTGALDPFMNVQVAGHHNDTRQRRPGLHRPVGDRRSSPTADGWSPSATSRPSTGCRATRSSMLDLTGEHRRGATGLVDPPATTPYCFNWAFDSYMRGRGLLAGRLLLRRRRDRRRHGGTLCDAAARFETDDRGHRHPADLGRLRRRRHPAGASRSPTPPSTSAATSAGCNNPNGSRLRRRPGAVPRPGLAALDPVSGLPLSWNPGRNPRGARRSYAISATADGLWVGSRHRLDRQPQVQAAEDRVLPATPAATPPASTTHRHAARHRLPRRRRAGRRRPTCSTGSTPAAARSRRSTTARTGRTTAAAAIYRNGGSNAAGWSPVPSGRRRPSRPRRPARSSTASAGLRRTTRR